MTSKKIARTRWIDAYLNDVNKHPVLSNEEQHALMMEFHETQDPRLAARIVEANLRLVVKIVTDEFKMFNVILPDLIQEGNIGLMTAVKKFDPTKNFKFSSYARFWIRANVLRHFSRTRNIYSCGYDGRYFVKVKKVKALLEKAGKPCDSKAIVEYLKQKKKDRESEISVGLVDALFAWHDNVATSIDVPVGQHEDDVTIVDVLHSHDPSHEMLYSEHERKHIIEKTAREFNDCLSERDKKVFAAALNDESISAVGTSFGVTRERARQWKESIYEKFYVHLVEKGLADEVWL